MCDEDSVIQVLVYIALFYTGGGGWGGGRPVSHGELMCGKLEGGGAVVGSYLAHCQPYTHNTHLQ
jgi:hypothetical protein